MPTTINGIGTHYYGKRNPTTHFGVCTQCNRELLLTDYETRLWFCVIFIPIIPLGRKQIVNQCPGCTYHYAVPLSEWQKQGDQAVSTASESLAENTSDAAKAIEMHATLSGFHRHEESSELAKVLLAKFGNDSEVLFYLASWHEHFTRFKEADELFVKASDRAPSDMDKQAAAVFALARQNECDAALKRMAPLDPPAIPDRPDLVRHVARQLSAAGRADEAYRLLTSLLEAVPQLKQRPDLQAEVRAVEKKLAVKQSLVPALSFWSRPSSKWAALAATIVIAVVAVEGWNLYVMRNAPIHAVSGINAPLEFSIDGGAAKSIPPLGRITFSLPEGAHRVTLLSPKLPGAEPFDMDLKQAWHERFFSKPAFVIDPSRTAVLVHNRVRYSQLPFPGPPQEYEFRLGDSFTGYPHIDHRFEDLPEKVEGNNSGVVYRTQLSLVEVDPLFLTDRAPDKLAFLVAMSKRRLTADPTDAAALNTLASALRDRGQSAELAEFVRLRLADDPPLISWHRVHQNLVSDKKLLIEEYDRLLASHPQSAAYLYLRGRFCDDLAEAFSYYDRAIAADPNFLYPYSVKSLEWSSRGNYVESAAILADAWKRLNSDAGAKLAPREANYFRESIGEGRLQSLISAGKYEEFDSVEKEMRSTLKRGDPSPLIYLSLLRQGKTEALRQHREERVRQVGSDDGLVRGLMLLNYAVYESDSRSQRQAAVQVPEPVRKQVLDGISFDEGSDPDCKTILGVSNEFLPVARELLTSLRCRERNEPFEAFRNRAMEFMKTGASASPSMLALFAKSPSVTIEDVDKISLQDRERGILLIALAYENPPQKEAMLRYARRLLTIPRLPQKCLDDWIRQGLGE